MKEEDIKNIYLINQDTNLKLFVFSEYNKEDPLRYNYYILSIRNNTKPILFESSSILESLKDNKTKMVRITQEDNIYPIFKTALYNARKIRTDKGRIRRLPKRKENNKYSYNMKQKKGR